MDRTTAISAVLFRPEQIEKMFWQLIFIEKKAKNLLGMPFPLKIK